MADGLPAGHHSDSSSNLAHWATPSGAQPDPRTPFVSGDVGVAESRGEGAHRAIPRSEEGPVDAHCAGHSSKEGPSQSVNDEKGPSYDALLAYWERSGGAQDSAAAFRDLSTRKHDMHEAPNMTIDNVDGVVAPGAADDSRPRASHAVHHVATSATRPTTLPIRDSPRGR